MAELPYPLFGSQTGDHLHLARWSILVAVRTISSA
jgi:hypothetical protein